MALRLFRDRLAHDLEDCRHQIDMTHGLVYNPTGALPSGQSNHQRHMDSAVVDEEAVEALAMLAESFSMVGCENQQRGVEEIALLESGTKLADQEIGVGDLTFVGAVRVLRPIGLDRFVGVVSVVEVQPEKQGLRSGLVSNQRTASAMVSAPSLWTDPRLADSFSFRSNSSK